MALSDRLNSIAIVKRNKPTSDTYGGFTTILTTEITSVACRVSLNSNKESERELGDKIDATSKYRIFTLDTTANSGIILHDVFVVSSKNYEVVGINNPSKGSHIEFDTEIVYNG